MTCVLKRNLHKFGIFIKKIYFKHWILCGLMKFLAFDFESHSSKSISQHKIGNGNTIPLEMYAYYRAQAGLLKTGNKQCNVPLSLTKD